MRRRDILTTLGGLTLGGLAGCSSPTSDASGGDSATSTPGATETVAPPSDPVASVAGTSLPVPEDELTRGAAENAIPAITDPAFGEDWSGVEWSLEGDGDVIGVVRDGQARAYPLAVLNWHEIVNDTFGGPLLVTYCPLCGSGVVAERLVGGQPTTFGVSGYLWNSDLVLRDQATRSLWSQLAATAIRGPQTGAQLSLVPSSLTTWDAWREEHPDTAVLLPPPKSETITNARPRDYDVHPYAGYDENTRIGIVGHEYDERLHPKTMVVGVAADGTARAYPLSRVAEAGVVNDTVGDLPVVVAVGPGGTLAAYERGVDGRTLTFEREDEAHLVAGGSRWRVVSGRAVDGPHEGTTLERANDESPMFWFAWADFNPDTEIYGGAGRSTGTDSDR